MNNKSASRINVYYYLAKVCIAFWSGAGERERERAKASTCEFCAAGSLGQGDVQRDSPSSLLHLPPLHSAKSLEPTTTTCFFSNSSLYLGKRGENRKSIKRETHTQKWKAK